MSVSGPGRVIDNGLVLYLDASNDKSIVSGSNTWFDVSRNGNNGTLTNGPTFNSSNGGSIVFDGTNDYVSIPNSSIINPSAAITVTLWYNSSNLPVSPFYTYCLMGSQEASNPFSGIDIRGASASTINFAIAINSVSRTVDLGNITINQWIFVCATYNGSALIGYRNGVQVQSVAVTGAINNSTKNLWIGNNISFSPRFYTGKIAATQIYNRALSPSEILQNYNLEKKRFGL